MCRDGREMDDNTINDTITETVNESMMGPGDSGEND